MTSTPRATRSQTPGGQTETPSPSSANRTTATARGTRMSTNLDTTPSSSDSSNEEPSASTSTSATPSISSTPIVPTRSRGENDGVRINRVLEPLLQAAGGNERPNDGAGESLPAEILQQLNTFCERQELFNERLEQRIVAFEEQSQKGREKKASRRLPKALTANVREVYKSLVGDDGGQVQWDFSKSCYACPFSNKATTTSKQFKKCSSGCLEATERPKPSKYEKEPESESSEPFYFLNCRRKGSV